MHALKLLNQKTLQNLNEKMFCTLSFQVHVMIYTVHTLLAAMRDALKPGDMDACLEDVLDVGLKIFCSSLNPLLWVWF